MSISQDPEAKKTPGSSSSSVNTLNSNSTIDIVLDVSTELAYQLATAVLKESIKKAVKEILNKEKFPKPSSRLRRIAEPSMTSYLNLYNNHRSVLTPDKVRRLEQKMADIRNYSQVISDDLKILIVDKSRGITQNQANQLKLKVMECLDQWVTVNPDQEIPRFLDATYALNCLKVVCANAYTVDWLKNVITSLNTPWEGAQLEATLMSTYSTYLTVPKKRSPKFRQKECRVKFAIPKTEKKVSFDEIKKRLEMCNPPMKTDGWKELNKDERDKSTIYYVSINNECLKAIETKGNRLFYLLGTIKIARLNENEEIACDRTCKEKEKIKFK